MGYLKSQKLLYVFGTISFLTAVHGHGMFKRQANNSENPPLIDSSHEESNEQQSTPSYEEKRANATLCGGLMLPKDYNKLLLPVAKDSSTYVTLSILIRSITDIDEQNEGITIDADIGMRWYDPKIASFNAENNYTHLFTNQTITNETYDAQALKCIWTPDVFIDQQIAVKKTSILSQLVQLNFLGKKNSSDSMDTIYRARKKLKLRCDMDFKFYPADTQTCLYQIRSYRYTADRLSLEWQGKTFHTPHLFLEDPSDANFDLQVAEVEPYRKLSIYQIEETFDEYRTGNYSALYFVIKARRRLSYHLVQTYPPSVLLVLITWLCFLIPSSMVEARIGISMTAVLTLTAMFAAIRQQSPKVSYTMAIDVWMVFNIFFVFVALSMFTMIYWMKLRLKRKQNLENEKEKGCESNSEFGQISKETYQRVVGFTKHYAFWAFAITFTTFFAIYWIWLLSKSNYFNWHPSREFNADLEGGEGHYGTNEAPLSDLITSYESEVTYLVSRLQNLTTLQANNETDEDGEIITQDVIWRHERYLEELKEGLQLGRTLLASSSKRLQQCSFLFINSIVFMTFVYVGF